jgi:hypothetical protein
MATAATGMVQRNMYSSSLGVDAVVIATPRWEEHQRSTGAEKRGDGKKS